jgi:hypothetical protein
LAWSARTILHAIEDIDQSHVSLLIGEPPPHGGDLLLAPSDSARLLWQAALSEHPTHSINIPPKSSAVATELRYALLIHWYRPPLKNGGGTSGLKRTIIAGSGDYEDLHVGSHFENLTLMAWPGYDQTDAFRFNKVINEPDFLPLHVVRQLVQAARLRDSPDEN